MTYSQEFAENVAMELNNSNYIVIENVLIKSEIPDSC